MTTIYSISKHSLSRYNIIMRNEVLFLAEEIRIKKKAAKRGEDGYKIVSVRMKDELSSRLDELSVQSNRSRNELINLLLESAVDIVKIED